MVERFIKGLLYINTNVPDKIVKCEFISSTGNAVLTFISKNPGYRHPPRDQRDILSSSPENWRLFELPNKPGQVFFAASFEGSDGGRMMTSGLYSTEDEIRNFANRVISSSHRDSILIHPIEINDPMTLEEFVRSVEESEETI